MIVFVYYLGNYIGKKYVYNFYKYQKTIVYEAYFYLNAKITFCRINTDVCL